MDQGWARAFITAAAFAIGFAGVWLYMDRDDAADDLAEPKGAVSETLANPIIFIPGVACDACGGVELTSAAPAGAASGGTSQTGSLASPR